MVVAVDGVEHLVGLFEHERRAATGSSARDPTGIRPGRAAAHDVDELLELASGVTGSCCALPTLLCSWLSRACARRLAMGDYASIREWKHRRSDITFAGFVLSLATTAAVHFGDHRRSRHRRDGGAESRGRRADDRDPRACCSRRPRAT